MSFSELGLEGSFKSLFSIWSLADSHEVLLSPVKCGVTLNISSSTMILSSFLFKEKNFPLSLFLFFSTHTKGEFDGVFWESLLPLVEGSISSLELSGIINLRLGFLIWEVSILSSMASSFISFISYSTFVLIYIYSITTLRNINKNIFPKDFFAEPENEEEDSSKNIPKGHPRLLNPAQTIKIIQ